MQFEAQHNSLRGDQGVVAVFGGSFNPVHDGHMGIVRALVSDADIERTWVLPARRSPFKAGDVLLPDDLRLKMLRMALRGLDGVVLSDLELRQPPPSYTFHTLFRLASLLPRARLMLVLGWDAFGDFERWYRAADILRLAGLLVFDRAGEGASPQPPLESLPSLLPPPFGGDARPAAPDRLVAGDGRLLLRRMATPLPDVSGRNILETRGLGAVPDGARELLAEHWHRTGEA